MRDQGMPWFDGQKRLFLQPHGMKRTKAVVIWGADMHTLDADYIGYWPAYIMPRELLAALRKWVLAGMCDIDPAR